MNNRRTRYWIDLAVQGSIVRRILVHWIVFFALCMVLLPIWRVISGAEIIGPVSTLLTQAWMENVPVFVLLLLLLPLFVWDTVKFSNRFAGPMYRVRTALRQAAAGERVRPVKLRKADFWKDVAQVLNTVLERLPSQQTACTQPPNAGSECGSATARAAAGNAASPAPEAEKPKKEAHQLV